MKSLAVALIGVAYCGLLAVCVLTRADQATLSAASLVGGLFCAAIAGITASV